MNAFIQKELELLFKDADSGINNAMISEIIKRNFVFSEVNPKADAVICSINPSFRKDETNFNSYSYDFDNLKNDKYYKKFHTLIEPYSDRIVFTYSDFLYQRHSSQNDVKIFLKNDIGLNFIFNQLILTQTILENIKPKYILLFNRMCGRFFGINRSKNFKNLWLGYKFKKTNIDNVFEIIGLEEHNERINKDLTKTNLEGTLVYFSKFIDYRTPKADKVKIVNDLSILFL